MRSLILSLVFALTASTCPGQGYWNGKYYAGRVCPRGGCQMCNSISQQGRERAYRTYQQPVVRYQQSVKHRVFRPAPQVIRQAENPAHAPTPRSVLQQVGQLLQPKPGDRLVELGCGDARIAIHLAQTYGCKVVGYEIDDGQLAKARAAVKAAGVEHLVNIREADARYINVSKAHGVYVYLYPELLEELSGNLRKAARVVSYQHPVPGLTQRREGKLYVYDRVELVSFRPR